MTRLRFLTAGESHGPALTGILEGLPAGLPVTAAQIDAELFRRQQGYGRGGRMKIEQDRAEILSGIRFGETLGSPVSLLVRNKDFASWTERMPAADGGPDPKPVKVPRPGHADLAGGLKYARTADLRDILERASARETTMRVALGAVAKALLRELGVHIGSYVRSIGGAVGAVATPEQLRDGEALGRLADASETRALDADSTARFIAAIDEARARRDTLGGVVEVVATGVPIGLGSHVQFDRKLDGRLAQAVLSVQAMKAVELGDGWAAASAFGSQVHDPISLAEGRIYRTQDRAGGLEAGITNGAPLVLRCAMKPIATVPAALGSVDLHTLAPTHAHVERSDTCAVPAAGVILESAVALALADALLEALGGDTMQMLRPAFARLRVLPRLQLGSVFLCGPMGAGKSTTGALLAAALGLPFVDLDVKLEAAAGAPVAVQFARDGEPAFRARELAALLAVARGEASVVALGGGAVLADAAWPAMRDAGVVLGLRAEPELLLARIQASGRPLAERPLLASGDPLERLSGLLHQRRHAYARADDTLDSTGLDPSQAAGALVGLLRGLEGPLARRARGLR